MYKIEFMCKATQLYLGDGLFFLQSVIQLFGLSEILAYLSFPLVSSVVHTGNLQPRPKDGLFLLCDFVVFWNQISLGKEKARC